MSQGFEVPLGGAPPVRPSAPNVPLSTLPPADGRGVPRWAKLTASLVLGVGCVVAVDARALTRELAALDGRWLALAFVLHLAQLAVLAGRWTSIARALGLPLGYRRALGEYALSVFVNQVLPGGVAGDGLRAVRHARSAPGTRVLRALEALAIDRASGQLACWLLVLLSAPLAIVHRVVEPRVFGGLVLAGLALSGSGWFLLDRLAPEQGPLARLRRSLRRFALILLHPRHVAMHLPLSVAFVVLTLLQLQVAALALGAGLELERLVWVGPLILCAASLPSFFGGWGIREGASAVLFAAAGLSGSLGVAVSVVYGVFGLLVSALGLGVYWVAGRQRNAPALDELTAPLAVSRPETPAQPAPKTG